MKIRDLTSVFRNLSEAIAAVSSAVLGLIVLIIAVFVSPAIYLHSLNFAIVFWTNIAASITGIFCLLLSIFLADRFRIWVIGFSIALWVIAFCMLASPMASGLLH